MAGGLSFSNPRPSMPVCWINGSLKLFSEGGAHVVVGIQ